MRLIFIFFLICIRFSLSAQSVQQQKTDSTARLIQQFHNKRDANGIYAMAGKIFRSQLTEKAFKDVFEKLSNGLGNLESYELESFINNVAKYKARYASALMSLYVSLDTDNKVETFYIANYESPMRNPGDIIATSNPLQTNLDKQVDSLVKEFMTKNNILGMNIGVLDDGKKHAYSYGDTKKGAHQLPDENTLFEIGSLSKTFTATLLAWFIQEEKIKPDDPINKYLPDSLTKLEFNGKPITIASLSNHTSGLPRLPDNFFAGADNDNPYKHYDDQKLFSFLKKYKPTREPGTQYEYSNLAFGLLAVILERVSGKSYEQLLHDLICEPLNMNNTWITLGKGDSSKFATGYTANGVYAHSWEFQSLAGAGAIRSDINDLLLYAEGQVAGGAGPLQKAIALTHKQTFASGQSIVALGWHISVNEKYLAHSGQTGGYTSVMLCDEQKKRAVVMQLNTAVEPSHTAILLMSWLAKQ